ncbi:MAG TPA: 50S ribosomal protein L27 [Candidatus Absconditabacterales bacterium]|nr:50S ribosomal protein L27 [Candidatus Absconditabacterales bacterium]HNG96714.1 50S ribosomal protein L27 [Candidatus Absconditabacterales bacterium]
MSTVKSAGRAENLWTSNPKYRGVKLFGGQTCKAGNIIIRQKGSEYRCGTNTYMGRDWTIHATIDGVVKFTKKRVTNFNGRTYLVTFAHVESTTSTPKITPINKAKEIKASSSETISAKAKKTPTVKAKTVSTKKTPTVKAKKTA